MKNIFEIFQPPFKYDDYGQMIFDKNNQLVLDVRGWGFLQCEDKPQELQDSLGSQVVEALNNYAQQRLSEIKTSDES